MQVDYSPGGVVGGDPEVVERDGRKFALVPLEDYPGLAETAYLLKSDENAAELAESIAWFNKHADSGSFDKPDAVPEHPMENVRAAIEGVEEEPRPRGVVPKDARIYSKLLAWAEHTVDSPEGLTSDDLDHFRYHVIQQVLPALLEPLPESASDNRKARRSELLNTLVYEHHLLLEQLRRPEQAMDLSLGQTDKQRATSK